MNLRRWVKANWHLKCCSGQLSFRIPPGVLRQEQRAIHQLRLNRVTSTASYQAFIRQIQSTICPHFRNSEETAEHSLPFFSKWAVERQQYFSGIAEVVHH